MKIEVLLGIIIVIKSYLSQNFTVSLNQSILLSQDYAGINTICQDFEGNFLVGFQTGEVRRYAADFSSSVGVGALSLAYPIDQISVRSISLSVVLSNGSTLYISDKKIGLKTDNFQTILTYNYLNYADYENFTLNQTIYHEIGFPLKTVDFSTSFHIFICKDSVFIAFSGSILYSLSYASYFGINSFCQCAYNTQFSIAASGDFIKATFVYYISFQNRNVYKITIFATLKFNFGKNQYSFVSKTFSKSVVFTAPSLITSILGTNGLLMMQSNSTGQTHVYNLNTSTMGTASGIPLEQTFAFFYTLGNLYILQSTGLSRLSFSSASNRLLLNAVMTSLPYNTYSLTFGTAINPFYIPGGPYIYTGGNITNNNNDSSTIQQAPIVSVNVSCSIANCFVCSFDPNICDLCEDGFDLKDNNCSLNKDFAIFYAYFQGNLQDVMDILKMLISIPAARRVLSPIFYYFGIFDDIYLFQFHDRVYGDTMNAVFGSINEIQSKKWSLINYQRVLDFFSVDEGRFRNSTDYEAPYGYFNYTDADHADVGEEGLWGNCQNFFVVCLPIVVVCCVLVQRAFRLLFHSALSRWIRKFEFWTLLFLLLFDGNVQQFAFYQATEWRNTFAFDPASKLIKAQTIVFGFTLTVVSFGLFFVSYGFYAKLNRHLTDNSRNSVCGVAALAAQFGAKNFCLGVMHSLLRPLAYRPMLGTILAFEALCLCGFALSLSGGVYRSKAKVWIYLTLNLLKMCLITTLFLDYGNVGLPLVEDAQQFLIFLQICVFLLGVVHESVLVLREIVDELKLLVLGRKGKQGQSDSSKQYLKNQLSYKGTTVYVANMNLRSTKSSRVSKKNKVRLNQYYQTQPQKIHKKSLFCRYQSTQLKTISNS